MFKVPKMLDGEIESLPVDPLEIPEPTPESTPIPVKTEDYSDQYLHSLTDAKLIPTKALTIEHTDIMGPMSKCPVFIHELQDGSLHCIAYVIGQIGDVNDYLDLIDMITVLREQDKMRVYIDSPGGYVATGAHVASAMSLCNGEVTTVARGFCASAASLMWSAGHKHQLTPFSLFMYHMSSHGDMGNSLGIRNRADDMIRYVKTTLLRVPLEKGHITPEELDQICIKGEDQYIDAKTMYQRLRKGV